MDTGETRYAIRIPYGLSLLAFHDPNAVVKGLNEFPREDWPNVPIVHTAFQIMVALGSYLALISLWVGWVAFRRRDPASNRALLWALALAAPMGFIAIEAGWTVTEVGRQPWIVYEFMRVEEAVTGAEGIPVGYATLVVVYIGLFGAALYMLRRVARTPPQAEVEPGPGDVEVLP